MESEDLMRRMKSLNHRPLLAAVIWFLHLNVPAHGARSKDLKRDPGLEWHKPYLVRLLGRILRAEVVTRHGGLAKRSSFHEVRAFRLVVR